jgi:integrase
MAKRAQVPPLQERRQPTLVQKRPGKWVCRFRWRGNVMERAISLSAKPTAKDDPPPTTIEKYAWRNLIQPYIAGTWSPYEDAIYGPQTEPERGPTVSEAKDQFLARYEKGSKTYESYEFVLRCWEATLESHTLVSEVEPDGVRAYVYREDITRATQRHSWRHLRAFFNWCIKERIIDESPIERVDPPRVEDKQMPFISPEEMKEVLKVCDETLPDFLSLAYRVALGAGLRRDELRYLQARDVNLTYNYLIVRNK